MKKNGILTLLFALIPGAGEMYQGYMKRGLSLITMFSLSAALGAMTRIEILYIGLPIVYMYSFFVQDKPQPVAAGEVQPATA